MLHQQQAQLLLDDEHLVQQNSLLHNVVLRRVHQRYDFVLILLFLHPVLRQLFYSLTSRLELLGRLVLEGNLLIKLNYLLLC